MGVFDGRKAVFMFMFSSQAEDTIEKAAATDLRLAGADILLVKAMAGQTWEAAFDTGAGHIDSLQTWQATVARGAAAGITVVPWVEVQSAGDAAIHAQLGPVLVCDLEQPPGFYTDDPAKLPAYLDALRSGGVKELYATIDPRQPALTFLNAPAWLGRLDGILPQMYWTDFEQPEGVIVPMLDVETQQWHAHVYPVLPYNAQPDDLAAAWQQARADGCQGAVLWRMGDANIQQLQAFAGLPLQAAKPTNDDNVQMIRLILAGDLRGAITYEQRFL